MVNFSISVSFVSFPFIINGDKYDVLDTIIKKGTPYVQIIPFKRDSWEMKIKGESVDKLKTRSMFFPFTILNNYKKIISLKYE